MNDKVYIVAKKYMELNGLQKEAADPDNVYKFLHRLSDTEGLYKRSDFASFKQDYISPIVDKMTAGKDYIAEQIGAGKDYLSNKLDLGKTYVKDQWTDMPDPLKKFLIWGTITGVPSAAHGYMSDTTGKNRFGRAVKHGLIGGGIGGALGSLLTADWKAVDKVQKKKDDAIALNRKAGDVEFRADQIKDNIGVVQKKVKDENEYYEKNINKGDENKIGLKTFKDLNDQINSGTAKFLESNPLLDRDAGKIKTYIPHIERNYEHLQKLNKYMVDAASGRSKIDENSIKDIVNSYKYLRDNSSYIVESLSILSKSPEFKGYESLNSRIKNFESSYNEYVPKLLEFTRKIIQSQFGKDNLGGPEHYFRMEIGK